METSAFGSLPLLIRRPKDFDAARRHPVILFLHGAGSRGADIKALEENPFFRLTETHNPFPFVVFAPQCAGQSWFDVFEELISLSRHIAELPFVDSARLYLMGASMGGYAAWQLAISQPQLFAALVPVCGGGLYCFADRLRHIPIRAFHGTLDDTVFPEESRHMVDAVNRAGGNASLTVYPGRGHDSWTDTYQNPEVFGWLLKQRKAASGDGGGAPAESASAATHG